MCVGGWGVEKALFQKILNERLEGQMEESIGRGFRELGVYLMQREGAIMSEGE